MSDDEFFQQTLARYERPLISYAKSITGDWESAKDAVQETFLRLSRENLKTLEPRLAAWLFAVCRTRAIDYQRKIVRFVSSEDGALESTPADGPEPPAQLVQAEDRAQLSELLARLPENQREVVKLKFEAGLSYREISEVTRHSVSNVGFLLHTAIQTLRRQWNQTTKLPTLS
ncbi:MAG TPA: sigma-70 family RNA polymerase sigma factor [Chthoniobacterales bacterium]